MQTILMVAHLIIAILLVGVILLQKTNDDGLGGLGGGNGGLGGIMSARSSATFFTRLTAVLATLFIINCLILANMSLRHTSKSIVDNVKHEQVVQKVETENNIAVPEAK